MEAQSVSPDEEIMTHSESSETVGINYLLPAHEYSDHCKLIRNIAPGQEEMTSNTLTVMN